MTARIGSGGIIAAGEGQRFREAGWTTPKAMVSIGGTPLIEHAVRRFAALGTDGLVLLVNERGRSFGEWVHSRFPALDLRLVVKTTRSSLESFQEVLARGLAGRSMVISTVDAWCPDADFARFVNAAVAHPPDATVLAVTPLVADERPLWVTLDDAGRVTRLGGASGELVTAGFYVVPDRARRLLPPPGLARLREYLAWLVDRGEPVYGVVMPRVVDVDRPEDVRLAEAWAEELGRTPAGERSAGP